MLQVGDIFTEKFVVSDQVYSGFVEVFKDTNPLHTQTDFAKQKGFKDKVMHGNILNGFLSYFIGEGLPSKDVMIISQTISFHAPVYLGNNIDFKAIIAEVSKAVKVYNFKFEFRVDSKKVAKGHIQIKML